MSFPRLAQWVARLHSKVEVASANPADPDFFVLVVQKTFLEVIEPKKGFDKCSHNSLIFRKFEFLKVVD